MAREKPVSALFHDQTFESIEQTDPPVVLYFSNLVLQPPHTVTPVLSTNNPSITLQ
jgi:hypothetical protein